MKYITNVSNYLLLSFHHLLRWDQVTQSAKISASAHWAFKRIPNVSEYKLIKADFDPLFILFGLKKRQKPLVEFKEYSNGKANKYIKYMFNRLTKTMIEKRKAVQLKDKALRNDLDNKLVNTFWILMNSTAYQVASYNSVIDNWHRFLTLKTVKSDLYALRKLCRQRKAHIAYSRAYIPKGDTYRPLGVPTRVWRVYLHMINNILTTWRLIDEKENQHGFIPGRGTITAWKKLIPMLRRKYVYELDYTKFFDKINLYRIADELSMLGLPESLVLFTFELNRSPVRFRGNLKLDESQSILKNWGKDAPLFTVRIDRNGKASTSPTNNPSVVGVPQGAPTSPNLATLALRRIEHRCEKANVDIVLYADDVILASDSEFDPLKLAEDKPSGIIINQAKSRWVKWDGQWVDSAKGLKFLGLVYKPSPYVNWIDFLLSLPPWLRHSSTLGWIRQWLAEKHHRLHASTRKGSNLELTDKESFLAYLYYARENWKYKEHRHKPLEQSVADWITSNEQRWLNLWDKRKSAFSSPLIGWIVSRLYSGNWLEKNHEANRELWCNLDSWLDTQWVQYARAKGLAANRIDIFNSSTFATAWLLEWLSSKAKVSRLQRTYGPSSYPVSSLRYEVLKETADGLLLREYKMSWNIF